MQCGEFERSLLATPGSASRGLWGRLGSDEDYLSLARVVQLLSRFFLNCCRIGLQQFDLLRILSICLLQSVHFAL